jgi:hypothetical protein
MTLRMLRSVDCLCVALVLAAIAITGCRSYHVEITVENRTGAAVQLLEVDYPSATFGTGSLAAGANFKYRVQVRGTAPVKVRYTGADSKQRQNAGPSLAEGDEGQLQIVLLPEGKADFSKQLAGGK